MSTNAVTKACDEYLKFILSEYYNEDELDNYKNAIFEAAMEYTHGDLIWSVINRAMMQEAENATNNSTD